MFFYGRHFGLLALMLAGVAGCVSAGVATRAAADGTAAFGLYGVLYSALIALTSRTCPSPRRQTAVIALGAVLSMLNVAISHRWGPAAARVGPAGPAVVLSMASALGAVAFGVLLRWQLRLRLPAALIAFLAAGCALSNLAVFRSGLYLGAPGPWFAGVWWLTFSAGLGCTDALRWLRSGREPVRSDP
jgi:hypothetical protein